jgi:hypothetical protein
LVGAIGGSNVGFHADMTLWIISSQRSGHAAPWLLSDGAPALVVGLGTISLVSAAVGYALAALAGGGW